jgi:hypothetical protein
MKTRALFTAALFLSSVSIQALAAATPEEAASIKASLEAYLGSTPGVVTVMPEGNAYTIKLDAAPYVAKIPDPSVKIFADPVVMKAEPLGNGQWTVTGTGTWGFQMSADKNVSVTVRVGDQNWTSTYDANLAAFTKSTGTFSNIAMAQSLPDPAGSGGMTSTTYNIQSITSESTATPAGQGVDSVSNMVMTGISTATTATGADGQPPATEMAMLNYSATSPKLSYTTTGKGLSYKPMLELLAWFVARPDKQLIINDQADLKVKLQAALPLFQSLIGTTTYEGLVVTTAFGQFEAASLGGDINMNGLVADGKFQERLSLTGFKMPAGLVPPWAQELVPTNFTIDFGMDGFNLEAPVQLALGQLDLSKPEPLPTGFESVILPAFLPNNAVNITIGASEISNALYSLTYQGNVSAGLAGPPTGKASVRMKGMDAVIAKLQAGAADPNVQQALAGLIGMKGFGKAEADGTILWDIDGSTPGKVLVNGLDVSAMLGMAPPPQQ